MKHGKQQREAGTFAKTNSKVVSQTAAERKAAEEAAIAAAFARSNGHVPAGPSRSEIVAKKKEQYRLAAEAALKKKLLKEITAKLTSNWLRTAAIAVAKNRLGLGSYGTFNLNDWYSLRELSRFSRERIEEIIQYANEKVELVQSRFKIVSDKNERVVLEPKSGWQEQMLPGPRTTVFHGTSMNAAMGIVEVGFKATTRSFLLLGPGVYTGPTDKAGEYKKPWSVLAEEEGVRGEIRFNGVMFEVEAVFGRTETVTSHYTDYDNSVTTLYGKAGVTPSGANFLSKLKKDEWCVRDTDANLPKRLRVVRMTIEKEAVMPP